MKGTAPSVLLAFVNILCLAAGQGNIENDCTGLSASVRNRKFFLQDRGLNDRTPLYITVSNTHIVLNNAATLTRWECLQSGRIYPPSEFVLARQGTDRWCFEFVNSQADNPQVVFSRSVRLESVFPATQAGQDAIDAYDASECANQIFSGNPVNPGAVDAEFGNLLEFDMLVNCPNCQIGSASNVNGFEFQTEGSCPPFLQDAYDSNPPTSDRAILRSERIYIQYNEGSGFQCGVNSPTSTATHREPRLSPNACGGGGTGRSYARPLFPDSQLYCVQPQSYQNIGGSEDNIHVFAFQPNGGTWKFICARVRELPTTGGPGSPRCWVMSLDLTDMNEPKCHILRPDIGNTNVFVDAQTAYRGGISNSGFTVIRGCYRDCQERGQNNRCDPPALCNQDFGGINCGTPAGPGRYNCPPGRTGWLCEADIDDCSPNPCQNLGTCSNTIPGPGYSCACRPGTAGINCELLTCNFPPVLRNSPPRFWTYNQQGGILQWNFRGFRFIDRGLGEYNCERDLPISNGVYRATVLQTEDETGAEVANLNERRCIQVIVIDQVYNDNPNPPRNQANMAQYFLVREGSLGFSASPLDPSLDCSLPSSLAFQVLHIPNEASYIGELAAMPEGRYDVEWCFNSVDHCTNRGTTPSWGIVTNNRFMPTNVCDLSGQPQVNPIDQNWAVAYNWLASQMFDVDGSTNGNPILIAVPSRNPGNSNPTYYCGRVLYDQSTFTSYISINVVNQLSPQCRPNHHARQCDATHLRLRLISNPCRDTPCLNGGVCTVRGPQSFECNCQPAPGWTGDRCQININDCQEGGNPRRPLGDCNDQGTVDCTDELNSRTCNCRVGWFGDRCNDEDSCQTAPFGERCQNGGTCVNSNSAARGYICNCVAGYTGPFCQTDINECNPNPCVNDGTCVESRDGEAINFYRCICPSDASGINCQFRMNACFPSNPCQNGGTCVPCASDPLNDYRCLCRDGWRFKNCEEVDECHTNPCPGDTTSYCRDGKLERFCFCREGYIGGIGPGDRPAGDCTDVDEGNPCIQRPCQNGGTCTRNTVTNVATCACPPNTQGDRCENRIIRCADNPCRSGAACTNRPTDPGFYRYECDCPSNTSGRNCEDSDDDFGIVEQALVGLLAALILGCIILGIWAICSNRCGPCKGCCP